MRANDWKLSSIWAKGCKGVTLESVVRAFKHVLPCNFLFLVLNQINLQFA